MSAERTPPQGQPQRPEGSAGQPADGAASSRPDDAALARTVGDAETARGVFDELPTIAAGFSVPEYRFEAVNKAYREFVGRQNLIGFSIREVFPEVMSQQLFELADRVRTSGQLESAHEWRFQLDLGATGALQEFFIDMVWAPRHAADGSVAGLTAYGTDVTDRVRERQAAERHAAEAERRYAAARDVVAALQEALLPTALPALPQVRVAARYLVAAEDQAAGGDWFDAMPLPDGKVALVVGDVVGHGVAASAAMGQLRAVLMELLTSEPDLAIVLQRLDAFAARDAALRAATLAIAALDPATGELRYSLCGHPPPLLVDADGSSRFLPDTGSGPLGTGAPHALATDTIGPGELILLYSDGLIERPGRTLDQGRAELAKVAGDAAANRALPVGAAATPVERVCQLTVELLTRTGYADDVTALAAQRLPAPVSTLDRELPSDPDDLPALRQALDEWFDELDPLASDRDALALAVWEAITNAVEHAYPPEMPGTVRLHGDLGSDGYVTFRISDHGSWRIPDPAAVHRGRGLLLAEQLTDRLRVDHPEADGSRADGAGGTTVTLRHRLRRPAVLASGESAAPAARRHGPPYAAQIDTSDGVPRVTVRGPVDITTADDLSRELLAAGRGGVLPLTVDLGEVSHLASAGVRVLHEIRDQFAAHGQPVTLIAPPASPARAVLDLVQLAYVDSADAAPVEPADAVPVATQ